MSSLRNEEWQLAERDAAAREKIQREQTAQSVLTHIRGLARPIAAL
jgi:hypothetical protein